MLDTYECLACDMLSERGGPVKERVMAVRSVFNIQNRQIKYLHCQLVTAQHFQTVWVALDMP